MGQWGLETSACDSVHDCLQEISVDTSKFTQKDVQPVIDHTWNEVAWVTPFEKLGVIMHLLTHELTVPMDKLEEVMEYANDELHPDQLANWKTGRKEVLVIEMNDIRFAMENGGKGRARHAKGLFEKINDMINTEIVEIDKLTDPMTEKDDNKVEDTLNAGEKTVKLLCYGIVVSLTDEELHALTPNRWLGGSITSDLQEEEVLNEDGTVAGLDVPIYNAAMDGIESMILGHAMAGIDVSTPAYIEGIETAVQGCANNI